MPGVPPTIAQESWLAQESLQAQTTPLQSWVSSWLTYLSENLPMVFLVVAVLTGILVLAKGGVKQVVIFAIGAALAFLLLTNLEGVADFLRNELPIDPPPATPTPS